MNRISLKFSTIWLLLFMGMSFLLSAQPKTTWHDSIIKLITKLNTKDCISFNKAVFYNGKYVPIAMGGYVYQNSVGNNDTIFFLYYYSQIKILSSDFERMRVLLPNSRALECYYSIPYKVSKKQFLTRQFVFEQDMQQLNDLYFGNNNLLLLNSYLLITTIGDSYKVGSSDYGSACRYYYIPSKNQTRMKQRLDRKYLRQFKSGGLHYFKIW